ncbi:MAG TPA: M15 family metallopeptidase, partial [Acidimicrobiia bacterium]|nr:M15 family metallopeptidase [Acidimicrobiia bacterium]
TPELLAPPPSDQYLSSVSPIPADVLARSTWNPECPVALDELAYVTLAHWGFDGRTHTGELIVNAEFADEIVAVFARLHQVRFPIEEMRVIRPDELDAPPTGDGNVTTSFVCRPAVGSTSWSMHAYGLAIDINPFHNPYRKGDLVLPELASYYTDRGSPRPGMILEGDAVVTAFDEMGWFWGGRWSTLDDWMHFSANNR